MRFFDSFRLALKNLWRQRLRSVLTIFAIVIGALSVITMISLVLGASHVFLSQIESAGALTQVTVSGNKDASSQDVFSGNNGSNDGSGTKLTDAMVTKIATIPHVVGASASTSVYPLRTFRLGDEVTTAKHSLEQVSAYEPGPAADRPLAAGRNLTTSDGDGAVLIGSAYLQKLGYANRAADLVGKKIIFMTSGYYTGVGAVIPTPIPFDSHMTQDQMQQAQKAQQDAQQKQVTEISGVIVGVIATGPYDSNIDIPMSWARKMLVNQMWQQDDQGNQNQNQCQPNRPCAPSTPKPPTYTLVSQSQLDDQGYSSIAVKVDDSNNVDGVATEIKKLNVSAITAKEFLDTILKTFRIIGLVFGAIGAISLFVAAIGVINTMVMATLERTREIGVMRAVGAPRGAVSRLFTMEAALLGFWGGVVGVLCGIGLSKIANSVIGSKLASQGISVANVISLPWWLIAAVIGTTTLVGMLAGLYPAVRASRLNPVEALRYE